MEMKNIAIAFINAKKDFSPALKTSLNPHFKSKYADLAACIEAVDGSFLKNGIVMYQETFDDASGVTVETVLLHESGEVIRCGRLHVPASKQDAQGYGSALSYARRYSLMAACGIAPEDDDGNAAVKSKPQTISEEQMANIIALATEVQADMTGFRKRLRVNKLEDLLVSDYPAAMALLETKRMKEAA